MKTRQDDILTAYLKKHELSQFNKDINLITRSFIERINLDPVNVAALTMSTFRQYMYEYFNDDKQNDIEILLHTPDDEIQGLLTNLLQFPKTTNESLIKLGENLFLIPYKNIELSSKIKVDYNKEITKDNIKTIYNYFKSLIINTTIELEDINNIFNNHKSKLPENYYSYISNEEYLKIIYDYIKSYRFTNLEKYFKDGDLLFNSQNMLYSYFRKYRYIIALGGTGIGKTAVIPLLYYHYLKQINQPNPKILICEPRISTTKNPFKYLRTNTGTDYKYSFNNINKILETKLNIKIDKDIPISDHLSSKYYINSSIQMQYRGHKYYSNSYSMKFVTDGILYNKLISKPDEILDNNLIVIDEVHENSINSLFGLVLINSYIENDEELEQFKYKNLNVMLITAMCQPIEKRIFHNLLPGLYELDSLPNKTSYKITEIYRPSAKVEDCVIKDKNGLVFVPVEMMIDSYLKLLTDKFPSLLIVKLTRDTNINLYKGDISEYLIKEAINKKRKYLIIATNVAESSITFPMLNYCIDLGRQFNRNYDPYTKMTTGDKEYMTLNSKIQRMGRVGRDSDGIYIRLYDQKDLLEYKNKIKSENISMQLITILCSIKDLNIKYKVIEKLKKYFDAEQIIQNYIDDFNSLKWISISNTSYNSTRDLQLIYNFHKKIESLYNNSDIDEGDESLLDNTITKTDNEDDDSKLDDKIVFQLTVLLYYCYIPGTIKLLVLYITKKLESLLKNNNYLKYIRLQKNNQSDIILLIKYLNSYNLKTKKLETIIEKFLNIKTIRLNEKLKIVNRDNDIFDAIKRALYFNRTTNLSSKISKLYKTNKTCYVLEITKDLHLYHSVTYIRDNTLNLI